MRLVDGNIELSASDLSVHLECGHLTAQQKLVALGKRERPKDFDPLRAILAERGEEHERRFIEHLQRDRKLSVQRLDGDDPGLTRAAMNEGADIIVQAPLASEDWRGRADILRKTNKPSDLGAYSYEVMDTKLARQTKAGTILQLCLYSELVAELQGHLPDHMFVVSPGNESRPEPFRVLDYTSYFRLAKTKLKLASSGDVPETYPEPVERCDVCTYWRECDTRRRNDDHLCLVAGMARLHREELVDANIRTMAALGSEAVQLPAQPKRGSRMALERLRHQARIQMAGRKSGAPKYELFEPENAQGLNLLPERSPGDVFFDIEGARYVQPAGMDYLFGYVTLDADKPSYVPLWALDAGEEQQAFERIVDMLWLKWKQAPSMHVYHFGHYEPTALKRLMQRYASRQDQIDDMLRAGVFVDLHTVVRQSLRASVEQYSLKDLEPFCGYERQQNLGDANQARHAIERVLEAALPLDDATHDLRHATEAYNRDDCLSTLALRKWLEERRRELEAKGHTLSRPLPGTQDDKDDGVREDIARLQTALLADVPATSEDRTPEQQARYVLAHLLEWHRQERSAGAWEYFRLRDLSEDEYLHDKDALAGLEFVRAVPPQGRQRKGREVYRFPPQEFLWNRKADICDGSGQSVGRIEEFDSGRREITITNSLPDGARPRVVFQRESSPNTDVLVNSLVDIATWAVQHGFDSSSPFAAAFSLLLARAPNVTGVTPGRPLRTAAEEPVEAAVRLVRGLQPGALPIQGPPGAGKTYTAAKVIDALVAKGKKVGVMAVSHKVIEHVLLSAREKSESGKVRVGRKPVSGYSAKEDTTGITAYTKAEKGIEALATGEVNVFGATQWFWADPQARNSVDVLVIDEAGQLSLANALAASPASPCVVLVGDPQQLEQPVQANHPDGAGASVLEHVLRGQQTIPDDRGLFLSRTRRLHPNLTRFTSEQFYDSRLEPLVGLERQTLAGCAPLRARGCGGFPLNTTGVRASAQRKSMSSLRLLRDFSRAGASQMLGAKQTR